jgi:hypothetical protein
VKRLVALLLGGLGLRALLRRRRPAELGPSPAEGLRAKIAESRATTAEPVEETPPAPVEETPPATEAPPQPVAEPTVDDRRADVHARAREAIDDLKD